MKITHVIPFLIKGGAERVTVDLASQAALKGHEVSIVAAYPVDVVYWEDILHPNVCVRYVSDKPLSKLAKYFFILYWLWKHRSWLAKQDILHCHLTYGMVFGIKFRFFRLLAHWRKPVVLGTCHLVGMDKLVLLRWFHARIAERLDAYVLMAKDSYWCRFIESRPALPSKIIPNGISFKDLTNLQPAELLPYRRKIGIPDKCQYVVGTVGRLNKDRRPWLYLPIFVELAKVFGEKVHFVIGGDGPEMDRMRLLINQYGLEKQTHLLGLVQKPRICLSIMDLYLTLSVGSFAGIAALEAAYMKVPVLAIQLLSDYKIGLEDWIFSHTDLFQIAQKSIELLSHPEERNALGLRQSSYVQSNFTVELMAKAYFELYQELLKRIT